MCGGGGSLWQVFSVFAFLYKLHFPSSPIHKYFLKYALEMLPSPDTSSCPCFTAALFHSYINKSFLILKEIRASEIYGYSCSCISDSKIWSLPTPEGTQNCKHAQDLKHWSESRSPRIPYTSLTWVAKCQRTNDNNVLPHIGPVLCLEPEGTLALLDLMWLFQKMSSERVC